MQQKEAPMEPNTFYLLCYKQVTPTELIINLFCSAGESITISFFFLLHRSTLFIEKPNNIFRLR